MIQDRSKTVDFHLSRTSIDQRGLAVVLERYLASLEAGAPLDIEVLAAQYPHWGDELRQCAVSLDLLHVAAQSPFRPTLSTLPEASNEPTRDDASVPDLPRLAHPRAPRSVFPRAQEDPPATPSSSASKPVSHPKNGARRLGDFEIGSEVGRGGMGIVYEATQISLQRRVALKVLPFAAVWDQKQVARFQNEARAAAQLQHPHIVPVFAVGQERGVHYLAMQFIDGQPLDQSIRQWRHERTRDVSPTAQGTTLGLAPRTLPDGHEASVADVSARTTTRFDAAVTQLSTKRRRDMNAYCRAIARLGVQAAEAIQYAHECGVVHRDLKPSNMLIDGQGNLWITDFGLARVENSPGVTTTGDVIGTLRYMSPEQAAGRHALVDACSDVYALGASLYELLTLEPAFVGDDRQAVQHAIAAKEPIPPRRHDPGIPLDLETIVLQAMSKSRDQRYATAAELADDLHRFLDGKATKARRRTAMDHVASWVKRHRNPVAIGVALLVAACTASTFAMVQFSRAHARTQAALVQSERSRSQARQVVDRFGVHFSRQLALLPGSAPLQQELLGETLALYRQFIAEASDDPTLAEDVARTHFQAGTINWRLGAMDAARASFTEALTLFEQGAPAGDASAQTFRHQAACWNNLGLLASARGDTEAARDAYERALNCIVEAPADVPGGAAEVASGERAKLSDQSAAHHAARATDKANAILRAEIVMNRALLERQAGDAAAAATLLTDAARRLQRLVDANPHDPEATHALAIALNSRSFVEHPDWRKAQASCQAAVDLLQQLCDQGPSVRSSASPGPAVLGYRNDLALCLNNLAAIFAHQNAHQAARTAYERAIALQIQLARQSPADVGLRAELAVSWNNLGQSLAQADDRQGADEAFLHARELLDELTADYPGELRYRSSLAGVLNNQAMSNEQRREWDLALAHYEQAIAHQRTAFEQAPDQRAFREYLNKHYVNYARVLRAAGRPADALAPILERRQLWADDGEKLIRVAAELGATADALQGEIRQTAIDAAVETCRRAHSAGRPPTPLDRVAEFADVTCRHEIQSLIGEEP